MATPAAILLEPRPENETRQWRERWKDAWFYYELECWYEAYRERDFPYALLPDKFRLNVYSLVTERQKKSA